jgi:MHS family proline/betaine transporter-like MFS transporter
LSYNLSAAIFGGTAPMVAMILQRVTGNQFAIGYYLVILAAFTLCILRKFQETSTQSLSEPGAL